MQICEGSGFCDMCNADTNLLIIRGEHTMNDISLCNNCAEESKRLLDDKGKISDGYHTFDELYYHRMVLFVVICAQNKNRAWKSWKHDDGTMFDNYFIVGVETREGQYTYHYHKDHWWLFEVRELERAPKWDGHKPEDVTRLLSLPSDGGGDINQEGQN